MKRLRKFNGEKEKNGEIKNKKIKQFKNIISMKNYKN